MDCTDCGQPVEALNNYRGRCGKCHAEFLEASVKDRIVSELREQKEDTQRETAARLDQLKNNSMAHYKSATSVENIILTTESSHNLDVKKRLGIVSSEVVVGMNVFKDLLAGVRNIVGGRSGTVQKVLHDIRIKALNELKQEASNLGADAVVGVDLDYLDIGATGSTMMVIIASGTAVKLEADEINPPPT